MKNLFVKLVALGALSIEAHAAELNNSMGQMNVFVASPTNVIVFTNTLALTNDVTTLQTSNVGNLLLTLQTNIEETLSVLSFITTNASAVQVSSGGRNSGVAGPFVPGPASPFLPPFGVTSGASQQTALVVPVGTNFLVLNQATFQAAASLENDLAGALPVLQSLNGTAVTSTNINGTVVTAVFTNPIPVITNNLPFALTNTFTTPLTNQSRILGPIVPTATPSAF